ncbi:unnamed protein product [Pedinophyceae sp. YPF-701]|nr:unnamed protein product [Pedinophyceae sp. YPF-701]
MDGSMRTWNVEMSGPQDARRDEAVDGAASAAGRPLENGNSGPPTPRGSLLHIRDGTNGLNCSLECPSCGGPPRDLALAKPPKPDPRKPTAREGYLKWDDYFMAVASLSAQRSKDPNKQVGACIVSAENVILGIGYNGFPRGCHDDDLPWAKESENGDPLDTKYPFVCHAEMNAIMNKNSASLQGARIFVTLFPCNECAKLIIQAGIREVVYYEDKNVRDLAAEGVSPTKGGLRKDPAFAASKKLLAMAGVALRQHRPRQPVVLALMP